ncbi:type II toxin-antitoxin system RnlB family antitoxin [Geotoga petraea]|jgi:hypothetical protein|uniref:Type II toxin-antitoxin system RnlB family antitoxin n=1 Tax=Geotoga petraea TaxID=28234 RepID=A0A4Z0VT00_9BACT|nr:type II toxin-antitoxin system RnlB family antitoxin [Geotoga petraea]TGG86991.1 type II toxin-antitoxin system RnlB family antitoxin [Geotoga petraea]
MKNYLIKKNNQGFYDYLIFATNFESPLNNLLEIEKELSKKNFEGKVLFDLLISNGDEHNRYIESYFDGNNFDHEKFKIVSVDNKIQNISTNFFKKHTKLFENSVLSSIDIFKISRV